LEQASDLATMVWRVAPGGVLLGADGVNVGATQKTPLQTAGTQEAQMSNLMRPIGNLFFHRGNRGFEATNRAVPEPSTFILFCLGLLGLLCGTRQRRREWITTVFRVSIQSLFVILAIAGIGASGGVEAKVIGVSIPIGSSDGTSHPHDSGIWGVTTARGPAWIETGIGYIVNPNLLSPLNGVQNPPDFSLHDHVYVSANVPDPSRAVVTYQFDVPTVVSGIEIIQHQNGISRIEGFYGDSLGSLTSLGSVFGPSGDITGAAAFTEGADQVFDFGNTTNAGTFFQFIIRKTPLTDGYASYRDFALDQNGQRIPAVVPEPRSLTLLGLGVLSLFGYAWRRRKWHPGA
jgi:hypothetical protein